MVESSLPENFEIKLFSELKGDKIKRKAFLESLIKHQMTLDKHVDRKMAEYIALTQYRKFNKPVNVVFCAFMGNKGLGFLWCLNEERELRLAEWSAPFTPRALLKVSKKTVGRLLLGRAADFAFENHLRAVMPDPMFTSDSFKRFRPRLRATRIDEPKPVTQRASWRARQPR